MVKQVNPEKEQTAVRTKPAKLAVHEILDETGLEIVGWETVNCGFGIEVEMPIIVKKETGEQLALENFMRTPVLFESAEKKS